MSDLSKNLPPFLKWAGGKRWFVAAYSDLFPRSFERYVEPFLGSGAVFFYLKPKKAVLSDINSELIDTYVAIRKNWKRVERLLTGHQKRHCKNYYYVVRAQRPIGLYQQAAKFLYLNRACWNGLYRVNLKGEFNVPIGTKSNIILESDDFESVARLLGNAELLASDFESVIDACVKGDFLFVDPPYTVKHNYNGFVKYNNRLFSWDDQLRLHHAVVRAKERGVSILLTNAYHESLRELYGNVGKQITVSRASVLAGDASKRRPCEEMIVRTGGSD